MKKFKVNETKELLKKLLVHPDCPPIYLWGSPGIGKSSICKQVVRELGWDGRFKDIRALTLSTVDVRGVPFADVEKRVAVWTRPDFIPPLDWMDKDCLILYDELANAPHSIQGALYQAILDGYYGEHEVGQKARRIAASNLPEDKTGAGAVLPALANRFALHLFLECDLDDWKRGYAYPNSIASEIIAFLEFQAKQGKNSLFDFDPRRYEVAFATPRTWEYCSWLWKKGFRDYDVIASCIGERTAADFFAFLKYCTSLPDISKILDSGEMIYPEETSHMYITSSTLTNAIYSNSKSPRLENFLEYLLKMPNKYTEFGVLMLKDTYASKELATRMNRLAIFKDIVNRYKEVVL